MVFDLNGGMSLHHGEQVMGKHQSCTSANPTKGGGERVYLINANFALLKIVGDLSPDRRRQVEQAFPELHQMDLMGPGFSLRSQSWAIVVIPTQILYVGSGDSAGITMQEVSDALLHAHEALGLAGPTGVSMKVEGLSNASAHSRLRVSTVPVINVAEQLGAKGVGYRFIIDTLEYKGDVRIEPYLRDDSRAYINVELAQAQGVALPEELLPQLSRMWDLGVARAEATANEFFNEVGG